MDESHNLNFVSDNKLMYSCKHNHIEYFKESLKSNININSQCLHYVGYNGNIEMANLLIEKGIDVNLQDNYGNTALHCACYNNHIEIVILLLNAGVNVNIKNNNGETALFNVCKHNNEELVKLLLDNGCVDYLALHKACKHGRLNIVKLLMENKAIKEKIDSKDNRGNTSVHFAWDYVYKAILDIKTNTYYYDFNQRMEILKLLLKENIKMVM